jgi:hypothetical protein
MEMKMEYTALDIMRELDAQIAIEPVNFDAQQEEALTLEAMKQANEFIKIDGSNEEINIVELAADAVNNLNEANEILDGVVIEFAEEPNTVGEPKTVGLGTEEFWVAMLKGYRGTNDPTRMRAMFERLIADKPIFVKDARAKMAEVLVEKINVRFLSKNLNRMAECNLISWDEDTKGHIVWL